MQDGAVADVETLHHGKHAAHSITRPGRPETPFVSGGEGARSGVHDSDGAVRWWPPPPEPVPQPRVPGERQACAAALHKRPELCGVSGWLQRCSKGVLRGFW